MLTRFATAIWKASTDRLAYIDAFSKRSTGSALGYLYMLCVTLTFFGLLPFAIGLGFLAPHAQTFADTQLDILERWYPDDLALTFSGTTLSTNADGPVVLDLPPEWQGSHDTKQLHAVVIDTDATVDDFYEYETMVLMTKTMAAVKDDNGFRVVDYDDFDEGGTIDQAFVTEVADALRAFTPYLPAIAWTLVALLALILPWVIGGFAWGLNLFFLLWASLLLWACSAAMGRGLTYGRLYHLGLFGVTSSLVIAFGLRMTAVSVPLLPSLAFFAWMIAVIAGFPHSKTHALPPLPPAATTKKILAKKSVAKKKK